MKDKSPGSKEEINKKGMQLRKDAIGFSLGILLVIIIMTLLYILFEK
ncbi:hypothetical protein M2475_000660 [Breznakia sp. PF5-3]|nr:MULTISPECIES: hypothetical protein [unclassified Breznakia]MDL2276048.1 hypothetical protein [Breznakia sp. OttesenSCG-928-G09]MDF9824309.1 hypothetical protein [Breznakia sp. PM6-1]MDF9835100.1 hypothetical protein [Breznakia sp. PF5-3]MDF9838472.1 hypothetical protein [Breznakia sp. PFB2-8]MDF9860530.1 hypothetical protein [Breznakia sp. PH5-24]